MEETFDAVIVGIGIQTQYNPRAKEAGFSVDDGILVNKLLQTDDPDIFAAGDVCRFEDVALMVPGLNTRIMPILWGCVG